MVVLKRACTFSEMSSVERDSLCLFPLDLGRVMTALADGVGHTDVECDFSLRAIKGHAASTSFLRTLVLAVLSPL